MQSKIHDVHKFQQLSRTAETDWKKIGIELKLEEFIENLEQNDFDSTATTEILDQFADKLQATVENLSIKKMKPRKSFDKNPLNAKSRVVNFSSDECFHGSLEFLGSFTHLKSLSIVFDPGFFHQNYQKRFFQVATIDIENIGKALISLRELESFAIRRSDLSEPMKIRFLIKPMELMRDLVNLDLSYCKISSSKAGEDFANLLKANRAIKHLELKGNSLDISFCNEFANGIKAFDGNLNFLGLSMNPIRGNGLGIILNRINDKQNVSQLEFSNCSLNSNLEADNFTEEIISLLQSPSLVQEINMNENEITIHKAEFIEALKSNFEIKDLSCENCGENNFLYRVFIELDIFFLMKVSQQQRW